METPADRYYESGAEDRPEKIEIRQDFVDRCSIIEDSPLIFTFPGKTWKTEKMIMEARINKGLPPANFICVEYDRKTFNESVKNMPDCIPWRTKYMEAGGKNITLYKRDFGNCGFSRLNKPIDFAWIDFVGQLTYQRLEKLKEIWTHISKAMFITTLAGRWQGEIRDQILSRPDRSLVKFLKEQFPDGKILPGCERAYGGEGYLEDKKAKMIHIGLGKPEYEMEEMARKNNDSTGNLLYLGNGS